MWSLALLYEYMCKKKLCIFSLDFTFINNLWKCIRFSYNSSQKINRFKLFKSNKYKYNNYFKSTLYYIFEEMSNNKFNSTIFDEILNQSFNLKRYNILNSWNFIFNSFIFNFINSSTLHILFRGYMYQYRWNIIRYKYKLTFCLAV